MRRVMALLQKELIDLSRNPAVFVPAVLTAVVSICLPFLIAVVLPAVTGEPLTGSSDFRVAIDALRGTAVAAGLDGEGLIQAWILRQFVVLLVLTPVAASMASAAYSVVGEKQARTLEPLLTTPLTTAELLAAKVLGSLLPATVLTIACFGVYVAAAAAFAREGVYATLLTGQPLATVFVLGPLAALAALQLAVCVSSRVNDARSAQQIGALVILPVAGLLVAQLTGALQLSGTVIAATALVLLSVNAGLALLGVTLFDRESILTRWK
ncbi:MAG: ABC transporter permease [Vicinamibacterales bacterium]